MRDSPEEDHELDRPATRRACESFRSLTLRVGDVPRNCPTRRVRLRFFHRLAASNESVSVERKCQNYSVKLRGWLSQVLNCESNADQQTHLRSRETTIRHHLESLSETCAFFAHLCSGTAQAVRLSRTPPGGLRRSATIWLRPKAALGHRLLLRIRIDVPALDQTASHQVSPGRDPL